MDEDDAIAMPDGGSVTRTEADRMLRDPLRAADGSTGVRVPGMSTCAMVSHVVRHAGGGSCGADDSLH